MLVEFPVGGKLNQTVSQAETLHCCSDAFDGGFVVDGFWECLFADQSSRLVCSESSLPTSFSVRGFWECLFADPSSRFVCSGYSLPTSSSSVRGLLSKFLHFLLLHCAVHFVHFVTPRRFLWGEAEISTSSARSMSTYKLCRACRSLVSSATLIAGMIIIKGFSRAVPWLSHSEPKLSNSWKWGRSSYAMYFRQVQSLLRP
jgi:hypothetical protein